MFNVLDYLEQSAERFPDKIAFSDETESITFSMLMDYAKSVGTAIANQLGGIHLPVAVLTKHTVSDIVAFMGTLYSGNFYMPLDANAPADFLERRYNSASPALIINDVLPKADIDDSLLASIRSKIIDVDPVYSIFTSGSTGAPKAAVISHRSVINLVEWLAKTFDFSENTVFAGQNMFYFDASVTEIYVTLKCGCTTHILPKKYFISPLKVMQTLDKLKVNVIPWSTAAIKLLANSGVFDKYIPKYLSDVIFGGENMPAKQLNIWKRALPNVRYINVYGPTETTVDCTYYIAERNFEDGESIPIGYACSNGEILLLNGDKRTEPGETGEIVVRGINVGLGYYGNLDTTNKVFVQNPLNPYYRDIVYRTGDMAKVNKYGELVFQSRADGQVKHMGSRIELGEIETIATAVDGIELVCCIYDKEKSKIVMFYQGCAEKKEIAIKLSEILPRYMLPNIIIQVPKMPETPNGKIDKLEVKKEYYVDTK